MLEEPFVASKEIVEEKIRGNDRPYFSHTESSPLKFNVSFAFEDYWDTNKIREVARWLTNHDYYQELYFSTDPEKLFYALVVDDSALIHNGLNQGYITLTFRCDSPYSYSPIMTTSEYQMNNQTASLSLGNGIFNGIKTSLVVSGNNLVLNTTKPKWSDYATGTKWSDL